MSNILFVIGKYPNFGGTEKITTVLASAFAKKGHCVTIASFEQTRPELSSELDSKVSLIALSMPVNTGSNERILANAVRTRDIDVIMNQWCLPFYVTKLINKCRKGTKARLISVLHGVPDRSKKVIVAEDACKKSTNFISRSFNRLKLWATDRVIRMSEHYVYNNSDKYVVLSEGFIKSFKDYTGLAGTPKLLSIGNPITIPTDYSTDYYPTKKKQILYVGRMDMENKRVNRIIDVWATLYKQFPDWSLCLVGDGPHRELLEKQVSDNMIERVRFTGFIREEPIEYYKESSILMLTSDLEGFGLVVVEGMSYGVIPVVYGSYVSIYDMIESGKHGFITPMPFSAQETADVLSRLMSDEALRSQMSRRAVERSKDFNLDSVVRRWEDLVSC